VGAESLEQLVEASRVEFVKVIDFESPELVVPKTLPRHLLDGVGENVFCNQELKGFCWGILFIFSLIVSNVLALSQTSENLQKLESYQ